MHAQERAEYVASLGLGFWIQGVWYKGQGLGFRLEGSTSSKQLSPKFSRDPGVWISKTLSVAFFFGVGSSNGLGFRI